MRQTSLCIIVVIAALVASFITGWRIGQKPTKFGAETQSDTIYRTKVITVPNPPILSSTLGPIIRVPVSDTVRVRDTLFVEVQKEVKTYADSTFKIVVSGYQPSIDYLELHIPTRTVTIRQPAPRWSFGITAGIGMQYGFIGKRIDIGPGIMVGVGYRF